MEYFGHSRVLEVAEMAVRYGLADKRAALMATLPVGYVAGLQSSGVPQSQVLLDLSAMNGTDSVAGGIIPLEIWLRNASYLLISNKEAHQFFRDQADEVAKMSALSPSERLPEFDLSDADLDTIEEKIVHVNDLVPIGYLNGAERTGVSVSRMLVTRFENGTERTQPFSSEPIVYFGTGWMLGKQHLITNHHVINARNPGEATAEDSDFALQAENAIAHFDFNSANAAGEKVDGLTLAAQNKSLDYAVLKLPNAVSRPPLSLWGREVTMPEKNLPVNVIQHPGGTAKQIGFRNNLAAKLTDKDLAYFTDTEGGSSGSPVCTDEWVVIALHKASTTVFGKFEFQGKDTAWVNIGTRIDRIIEDLRTNHATLWDDIGASVVT